MTTEPLPDDCLPFGGDEQKLVEFLRGPEIGPDGRIIGGLWDGMTPAEVLAQRDRFNAPPNPDPLLERIKKAMGR